MESDSLAHDPKKRDAWLRRQRRRLGRHAGVYGIVNAAILVLGLLVLPFTPWWIRGEGQAPKQKAEEAERQPPERGRR